MVELLSPVGDFECLKAAVQNGANAVYFGSVPLSPMSVSTQFGFPTNISVTLFPFPDVSLIVFSAILIFT